MRFVIIFLLIQLTGLVSCKKDLGIPWAEVPEMAKETFLSRYPEASNIIWQKYYNQFHVNFTNNERISTAKFTASGDWLITQTPILYADIPRPIIDSLRASNYRNWVISDQNSEETPKYGFLYRLIMYDNTETKPLYYTLLGERIFKSYYNTDQ
ncbi:MAG: hypothetical protein RIS47_1049 [Bacteroidota bacterium]|jgi:hypothetical protein